MGKSYAGVPIAKARRLRPERPQKNAGVKPPPMLAYSLAQRLPEPPALLANALVKLRYHHCVLHLCKCKCLMYFPDLSLPGLNAPVRRL